MCLGSDLSYSLTIIKRNIFIVVVDEMRYTVSKMSRSLPPGFWPKRQYRPHRLKKIIAKYFAFESIHCLCLERNDKMKPIQKILVAIDFSQYSKFILEYALNLAIPLNAELVIANVINQRDIDIVSKLSLNLNAMSTREYIDQTSSERLQAMDTMMRDVQPTYSTYRKIIKTGTPFVELVQAIIDTESDIIVMGSKGRGNIAGVLFGSTAEKLFRKSPIPLLSLRVE
jgi:nucleotide-binding universal stress UspA family protein